MDLLIRPAKPPAGWILKEDPAHTACIKVTTNVLVRGTKITESSVVAVLIGGDYQS